MMVLDTNVVSELMRAEPVFSVLQWSRSLDIAVLFVASVTVAEIAYGLATMPEGRRRRSLEAQFEDLLGQSFGARVLPFDRRAALVFAEIAAARKRTGRPISLADAQIAATTRVAGFALATRNIRDFRDCGIDLIDPWATR